MASEAGLPPSETDDGEAADVLRLEIGPDAAGERLDKALSSLAEGLSRARLQALMAQGAVTRDGLVLTDASARAQAGTYEVAIPPPAPAEPEPQDIPLAILFEDAHLIVVDKPAGMAVHPAPGTPDGTLVNALLHHVGSLGERFDEPLRPGIVHRLDMDTSGVMIVAKHPRAHADLADQFRRRTVRKTYLAWVLGRPVPPIGRIDTHLARDPRHPLRFRVSSGAAPRARRAVTRYRLRATLSERSLLLLRPRRKQMPGQPDSNHQAYLSASKHLLKGRLA